MAGFSIKGSILEQRKNLYGSISIALSFMLFAFIVAKFFLPDLGSNAATQNASETVGPYTLAMSNDSVANVDITPTASQQIFTTTNNLTLSNSCSQGATISISTNSTTSNDLTRNGADSATKTIPATTGSSLLDNTWGFSTDGGTTYNPVPVKGGTATYVYDAVEAAENKNIPVQFGIKTDSSLPSGTYTTDVVYTASVKSGCLTYSLAWDLNGGTGKSGTSYATTNVNWGTTFDLTNYTPTRDGYTFTGWSNGSSTFTGSETLADLNPSGAASITMVAQWQISVYIFNYTGAQQTFTAPHDGYYKIELWGAQGGRELSDTPRIGGYGGYSSGVIKMLASNLLYCYIGQQGGTEINAYAWNGGGGSGINNGSNSGNGNSGQGGGATDCRTISGAWNNAASLRSRIIVAAGGGGAGDNYSSSSDWNKKVSNGGAAGGLTGYAGVYESAAGVNVSYTAPGGATQTSAGAVGVGDYQSGACTSNSGGFGYGGMTNSACYYGGGGGSGWYGGSNGGTKSLSISSGSGGSSYISGHTGSVAVTSTSSSSPKSGCTTGTTTNSCSITPYINPATSAGYTFVNTVMIDGAGYKWTNTKGSLQAMPNPSGGNYASGVGHSGNGYARITYLGNIPTMQTFDKSTLVNVGDSIRLVDERDGNFYTVKKLADGNIWMTENLRIVNKTITPADSNVTSNFTIPASATSGFNAQDTNNAYVDNTYGGYYTFYTATAGTGGTSLTSGDAPSSICPKGWRLPTGGSSGEFQALYSKYNSTTLMQGDPGFTRGGQMYNGSITGSGIGYYWSSTAYNANNAHEMLLNTTTVTPAANIYKYRGLSIHCVAN